MRKNDVIQSGDVVIRVLQVNNDEVFAINCCRRTMPEWMPAAGLKEYAVITEDEMQQITGRILPDIDSLDARSQCVMNERYTMIAEILPIVINIQKRKQVIADIAAGRNVSRQTVTNYLKLYLIYQDKTALAPKTCLSECTLSPDEKNFRWALNKFYYTKNKNSLNTTYTLMLKEKYCDTSGVLLPAYPTFNQFRYFYRKHKKMQTYYISRNGIKDYQRNHRPLLGDSVQEYADHIGIGMLDATVCDIYLINDEGNLVGRPILVACIDAYSSLCCGYSLLWEGGMYSLKSLMLNVIADKQEWCRKFGIEINKSDWDCDSIPGKLITDMGSEFKSENFEQITELGFEVVNLPSFRPELKGSVEKFFDLVQELFKPHLKGKGVIEPDYQERGAHDYRKDACLTMRDFEKVILHCIVYYNSQRIIKDYPYTDEMIELNIQPYANCIWEYGKTMPGANLIPVKHKQLMLTLLPRTIGKFERKGLIVNKMRYKNMDFTEKYLTGGTVDVAYNPDDVSYVWLIDNGAYIQFELIESRYKDKPLSDVQSMKDGQRSIVKANEKASIQAKIDLSSHIQVIAANAMKQDDVAIKGIRVTRQKERDKAHVDYMRGVTDE